MTACEVRNNRGEGPVHGSLFGVPAARKIGQARGPSWLRETSMEAVDLHKQNKGV